MAIAMALLPHYSIISAFPAFPVCSPFVPLSLFVICKLDIE